MSLPALLLALAAPVEAAEFQVEGFYRARGRAFDTRSLTRDATLGPEGATAFVQHRLWLRPRVVLSDEVALFTEFRGLDNVYWGQDPHTFDPFVNTIPAVFEYGLDAPGVDGDRAIPLDFTLWRAWGEVHTDIGRFTFGRVPLHWGLGIWLNDGVTADPTFSDFGDTTDRVMWEYLANQQVYVRVAVDVPVEGLIGDNDDRTAVSGAVAYRTEDISAGLLLQYDISGPDNATASSLSMFTVDLAGEATLGKLTAAIEGVGHFGNSGLFDSNGNALPNQSITGIGAAAEVRLDMEPWVAELRGGFASGDNNNSNRSRRTYGFDRDYSVGMFMFEQPMPLLASGTDRDTTEIRTGNRIANAIYVAPTLRRRLADGLDAHVSYLTARTAAGDESGLANATATGTNGGYGHEFQLGLHYGGIEHLELDARGALLVPGPVYTSQYNLITGVESSEAIGYDATAFGLQLSARIHF